MRHNRKRYNHHYRVGDEVIVVRYDPTKLQEKLHGPYPIVEIRTNGTVSLQRRPGISESFNIRKLRPYKGLDAERRNLIRQRNTQEQQYRQFANQQGLLLPETIGPIQNIYSEQLFRWKAHQSTTYGFLLHYSPQRLD